MNRQRSATVGKTSTVGETFWQCYELRWRATKNQRHCYSIVRQLVDYFGKDTPVSDIGSAQIQDWILYNQNAGFAAATINRKRVYLRQCLDHARSRGLIDRLPDLGKAKREGEGRERFLTKAEANAILQALPCQSYRSFATFLLYTGARVGEALTIRWDDIREIGSNTYVTFRSTTTKSGKARQVPMPPGAECVFDTCDPELPGPWAGIRYHSFHTAFRIAVDEAGISNPGEVVPHTLRHTCASWLVQKGVPIRHVQRWLGHASVVTTERYAKLADDDLLMAAAALNTC